MTRGQQLRSLQDTERSDSRDAGRLPTVSVIIPAYLSSPYIRDTLNSVLAQTIDDYELIVVNDGSPDTDTLEQILAEYGERIIYIKQENRGVSGARNAGIRAACAPILALLDADDMWDASFLAMHLQMMERDPTIDVLYSDALVYGDLPEAGKRFMEIAPSNAEVTFERLVLGQCTPICSLATMRRETVVRVGMFDESLRGSDDFDLWLRIVKQGGHITYHRQVLAHYRRRAGSQSTDSVHMFDQILRVLAKTEATMSLTPSEHVALRASRERFQALLRYSEGKRALHRRAVQDAISGLTDANAFLRRRKLTLALWLLRTMPALTLRAYAARERLHDLKVGKAL